MEDSKIPNPEPGTQNPEPSAQDAPLCQRTSRTINVRLSRLARRSFRAGGPQLLVRQTVTGQENSTSFLESKHYLTVLLLVRLYGRITSRRRSNQLGVKESFWEIKWE